MKILRFLGFAAALIGVVLTSSSTVQAQESFETTSHVTYKITSDGTAQVTHQFKVKNLTPTTYLSQHSLALSYPTIHTIRATTSGAVITPEITKNGTITTVALSFDESVVGEGQIREFTVTYTTPDIAQVIGEVLEVRIPSLSSANSFADHQITVVVPAQYGQPVRQVPKPDSVETGFTETTFNYTTTHDQGITLQFGSEQYFSIQTTYPLSNGSASPAYGQIALPPDTSFQRFQYRKLEPKPASMKIDEDGNWIATYLVPPNEELKVALEADVKLTLEPDATVPVTPWKSAYMAEKKYWELPENTFAEVFGNQSKEKIYATVIEKLEYDTKRVEAGELGTREGAAAALQNPTHAVCQEYADLLVAAWRRAGVPARRLNGYAYTTNLSSRPLSFDGTVLHTWVEYHDPATNLWHMVDPTWEDTTGGVDYYTQFDLNHIVFSIFGTSSEEPYPAGTYANSQDETDLTVKLTEPFAASSPQLRAEFSPVTLGSLAIPGQYTLVVTNDSGRAWYDIDMSLSGEDITIAPGQQRFTLLPFDTKSFNVTVSSPLRSGIIQREVELRLTPKNQEVQIQHVTLTAAPAIVTQVTSFKATTPMGGAALILLIGAGSILVFRRKRKTAVRWQSQKSKKAAQQLQASAQVNTSNQADGTSGKESAMESASQRVGSPANGSGINSTLPTTNKRSSKR